jgi:hypothetical protein
VRRRAQAVGIAEGAEEETLGQGQERRQDGREDAAGHAGVMTMSKSEAAEKRVDVYLATIERMEPGIAMVDRDAALASIAISLKRIADAINSPNAYGEVGSAAIAGAILRGLRDR